MLLYSEQIRSLESSILALASRGRPTEYLEERLMTLKAIPTNKKFSRAIDIFAITGKPISKFVHISEREAEQIQTFGYCLDGNVMANNEVLKSTQAYKFYKNYETKY